MFSIRMKNRRIIMNIPYERRMKTIINLTKEEIHYEL